MRGLGGLLRDAWRLSVPYFGSRSEERWSARIALAAIILLGFVLVGANVVLNFWNGRIYDSLQNKDLQTFTNLLLTWDVDKDGFMPGIILIVVVAVPLSILRTYLEQFLSIRWRRWMTNQLLEKWLTDRAYYTIGLTRPVGDIGTDNPDQRIAEDVRDFTSNTLTLGVSLIARVSSLYSFSVILYSLSGATVFFGITIPGYMLWAALLYAIVGTWLTHLVGRKLVPLNFSQQKAEADFRFALVRFRENTEGIALSGGEQEEKTALSHRFVAVADNWFRIMNRSLKLNGLIGTYEYAASVFPLIVGSPRYFAGQIALGGLMRTVGAFSSVQNSLSWFINQYDSLASWGATVSRLTTFEAAIKVARSLAAAGPAVADSAGDAITLDRADILLPNGQPVLEHAEIALHRGRSVTIAGRSGSGKSTLFRAIAGIWPFGHGQIDRPRGTYLFLPQRPYLPLGTLRHAITYPGDEYSFEPGLVRQALSAAGLPALVEQIDEDRPWSQVLSGGEQQRLAVARALLLRPDWLFMDEATSSLDPDAEDEIYTVLRKQLPETTIISIAHRPEVARYHDAMLRFERKPGETGTLIGQPAAPDATMASTAAP